MKRSNRKNREIDRLGEMLVKRSKLAANEVEQAVSDPELYSKVLRRILDERPGKVSAIGFGWQVPAVCSALVAVAAGTFVLMPDGRERVEVEPVLITPVPERVMAQEEDDPEPVETSVAKLAPATKEIRRKPRTKPRRVIEEAAPLPPAEFYAIGLTGGQEDAVTDGRVVRVELPRSTLFAMGVNVPLENGIGPMTAELLLGPDGAPRAIRLVE